MNKNSKRLILPHGMLREIATTLGISERTVYNAVNGEMGGKKSLAARQLAKLKLKEFNDSKMITEDEYRQALTVIEQYHRQKKITIAEFLQLMTWGIPKRLHTILSNMADDPQKNVYIHQINEEMLMNEKLCSKLTCQKFFELRKEFIGNESTE